MAVVMPPLPAQPLGDPVTLPRRAAWALWGSLAAGAALTGAGALAYLWPRQADDLGDAGAVASYTAGSVRHFPGIGASSGAGSGGSSGATGLA